MEVQGMVGKPAPIYAWHLGYGGIPLVASLDAFAPNKKPDAGRAAFKTITFRDRGDTDQPLWIWSGDTLMDLDRYQALKMTPKTIAGSDYLFVEAGGFNDTNAAGWKSPLIVMKRK
jgi:hypothetical protein